MLRAANNGPDSCFDSFADTAACHARQYSHANLTETNYWICIECSWKKSNFLTRLCIVNIGMNMTKKLKRMSMRTSIIQAIWHQPITNVNKENFNNPTVSWIFQVSAARQMGGASPKVQMLHWFTVEKAEEEEHKHRPYWCKNYSKESYWCCRGKLIWR